MTTFLFTTLPTNDLGLLTRSLPIARELAEQGHTILFCSPANAPSRLIAEAGFHNLLPRHPIYDLMRGDQSLQGLVRFITRGQWRQRYDTLFRFLSQLIPALPLKSAPNTLEVWNMDHAGALMGLLNEGFVRASCSALQATMVDCGADVVVDFWNPLAVIAARTLRKPVITVIQADAHPASQGFIWWKTPPAHLPTPVPVVNKVLAENGLPPVSTLAELCVGDLTLVVGMPQTDPLPVTADVTNVGLDGDGTCLHRCAGERRHACGLDHRASPLAEGGAPFASQLPPRTLRPRIGDGREERCTDPPRRLWLLPDRTLHGKTRRYHPDLRRTREQRAADSGVRGGSNGAGRA